MRALPVTIVGLGGSGKVITLELVAVVMYGPDGIEATVWVVVVNAVVVKRADSSSCDASSPLPVNAHTRRPPTKSPTTNDTTVF